MSVFSELNELHDTDPVAFEVLVTDIANCIEDNDNNNEFENIQFNTSEIIQSGYKLIFGERAVQALHRNGGAITHVESTLYYMMNTEGKLVVDDDSISLGMKCMKKYMDLKYGIKNR